MVAALLLGGEEVSVLGRGVQTEGAPASCSLTISSDCGKHLLSHRLCFWIAASAETVSKVGTKDDWRVFSCLREILETQTVSSPVLTDLSSESYVVRLSLLMPELCNSVTLGLSVVDIFSDVSRHLPRENVQLSVL